MRQRYRRVASILIPLLLAPAAGAGEAGDEGKPCADEACVQCIARGPVTRNAVRFDGSDDYVQVGSVAALEMTTSLTIEAWILPTHDTHGIIANKENEYEVARFPDGTIRWAINNDAPGWAWVSSGGVAPLYTWTHVAWTYDGAVGQKLSTYLNGELVHRAYGAGSIRDTAPPADEFRIGGRLAIANPFAGAIDEVRVWNVARSAAQIKESMESPLNGDEPGLMGYWRFEEGTGTTTADAAAGNAGTLVGAAWAAVGCDDGIACTIDVCDPSAEGGCAHRAQHSLCDDGNACTVDECIPGGGCRHTPLRCDDGNFCNGVETCDPSSGCRAGTPPACDDGVACTVDACDPALNRCTHSPDDQRCDDGRFCNGLETCSATTGCAAGPAPVCDDKIPCTTDTCDPKSDACVSEPNHDLCNDDRVCTTDRCDPSAGCVFDPVECPPGSGFCGQVTACDEVLGCHPAEPTCGMDAYCDGTQRACLELPAASHASSGWPEQWLCRPDPAACPEAQACVDATVPPCEEALDRCLREGSVDGTLAWLECVVPLPTSVGEVFEFLHRGVCVIGVWSAYQEFWDCAWGSHTRMERDAQACVCDTCVDAPECNDRYDLNLTVNGLCGGESVYAGVACGAASAHQNYPFTRLSGTLNLSERCSFEEPWSVSMEAVRDDQGQPRRQCRPRSRSGPPPRPPVDSVHATFDCGPPSGDCPPWSDAIALTLAFLNLDAGESVTVRVSYQNNDGTGSQADVVVEGDYDGSGESVSTGLFAEVGAAYTAVLVRSSVADGKSCHAYPGSGDLPLDSQASARIATVICQDPPGGGDPWNPPPPPIENPVVDWPDDFPPFGGGSCMWWTQLCPPGQDCRVVTTCPPQPGYPPPNECMECTAAPCRWVCLESSGSLKSGPHVSLTAGPLRGPNASLVADDRLYLGATAEDPDGVNRFFWLLDDDYAGQHVVPGAPSQATLPVTALDTSALDEGPHVLRLVAADDAPDVKAPSLLVVPFHVDHTGAPPDPCDADLQPPNLTLVYPPDGATLTGGTVELKASASDASGIRQVEFLIDRDRPVRAKRERGVYTYRWSAPPGEHLVTARAFDGCRTSVTTAPVRVLVEGPDPCASDPVGPVTALVKPQAGLSFPAGPLDVEAAASDANGVSAVDFFVDDSLVHTDDSPPYTLTFMFTTAGEHRLHAVAVDGCGNPSTSPTATMHIENDATPCEVDQEPPAVVITSPAAGAIVPRGALTVTAEASDNLGTDHVAFEIDGSVPGDGVDLSPPFSYRFVPTRSSQTIRARAEDVCGRHAWSPPVTFEVANAKPQALPDAAETRAGTPVTIAVLANDSDPDGDAVALALNPVIEAPTQGTAVRAGTSIVYTPAPGVPAAGVESATDRFRYRIVDSYGAVDSALATVTVRGNRKPVALPDSATTRADVPVTLAVLANDSDPDGDAIALTANPILVAPAKGTVSVSGSQVTYAPNAGFPSTGGTEADVFRYRIVDALGAVDSALVTVTLQLNRPPQAAADSASTPKGQALLLRVTLNDSDPDGDAVRLAVNVPFPEAPVHGTVQRVDDHTVRYTPAPGFTGTDRFRYRIADGHGGLHGAEVTIAVTP